MYPFNNKKAKIITVKEIIKCIIFVSKIDNNFTPIGVPIVTPSNKKTTNLQLILFQMLGIIKKLAIISNVRIIGTISFGGRINESKDTLDAEKPKPLKPLTNEAKRITIQKNRKFDALRFIVSKNSIQKAYLNLIILYIKLIKVILSIKLIGNIQIMHNKSSNRSFGILFFIVFLAIGLWPLTSNNEINLYLIIISIIFLILGILNSKILTPLNNLWIKFGELLGKIIAPIVMGVVYFIILTPISLLVRIFGKDLLGLKYSKNLNSYWIKRKKKIGTMDKQF